MKTKIIVLIVTVIVAIVIMLVFVTSYLFSISPIAALENVRIEIKNQTGSSFLIQDMQNPGDTALQIKPFGNSFLSDKTEGIMKISNTYVTYKLEWSEPDHWFLVKHHDKVIITMHGLEIQKKSLNWKFFWV